MVGHKHIAPALLMVHFPLHDWPKPHTEQDERSPEPGQLEKEWVPFFTRYANQQQGQQDHYGQGHEGVEPDAVQESEYVLRY